MDEKSIQKIIDISVPHTLDHEGLTYVDKTMRLLAPDNPPLVECSTLQGLADLITAKVDGLDDEDALVIIDDPRSVTLASNKGDEFGRRKLFASCDYPEQCSTFQFGAWMNPESFIIAVQQGFQRVKIEGDDGKFAPDLDYVLGIASKVTAENSMSHEDDGIAQRVAVKQGVSLKAEAVLKPLVNLAPYRTFAEIDQVVSTFVFRVRVQGEAVQLALFEGDGGRWRIAAVAAIKAWLSGKVGTIPIIG